MVLDASANPATAITAAITTAATGTLIALSCPTGSTNTAAGATIASCLVTPGYYIDPSNLNVPAVCAVGEYCPGNGGTYLNAAGTATATLTLAVGTAGGGGEYNCPAGSATPGTAPSAQNSALTDCNLLPHFYIPSTATTSPAIYVPVACPTGYFCAGGGAIGAAGGSVSCTGSSNPACATTSVTANSSPVSVSPTSQPINLNATPVVVNLPASAAPLAAAANSAVLALAALLALVAF